ncbi:type II toxin-antitoxin system HicA family toxin [Nocardiopsis suaedae]|uniref:Type II toxin-antitoxin system HicA family toxin n=1 Tax=Nocardiopsis suaedae TaxID=3018444 RepID=A0ABT4TMV6_9ACTN|nr:type II toxin-antitoxin system HicA family toxin [Nocardiopsis suaedae]MDA2806024.1 type II toxin-antitoxin system HicA family toxin [Nocardiopsis suaedae]
MKQRKLLETLRKAADKGATLVFVRHGSRHDIYSVSGYRFVVPRHADIAEPTARRIIKEVEDL